MAGAVFVWDVIAEGGLGKEKPGNEFGVGGAGAGAGATVSPAVLLNANG